MYPVTFVDFNEYAGENSFFVRLGYEFGHHWLDELLHMPRCYGVDLDPHLKYGTCAEQRCESGEYVVPHLR